MSQALKMLLRLAKVREAQALAQVRRVVAELSKTQALQEQVKQFVFEYGEQMFQTAQQGAQVSFLLDSLAFKERLESSAVQQEALAQEQKQTLEKLMQEAFAASMKVKGLEKILSKKAAEARKEQLMDEANEVEDGIAARHVQKLGMKDA